MPTLYLIPVLLGESETSRVLPGYNHDVVMNIKHFIVEDVRSARRFLKKMDPTIDIDELTFFTLNRHTSPQEIASFLDPMKKGFDMGVISEAGCPAIADPGADVVRIAQDRRYRVVPLVGPSSILLSLMASGFNGQSFAFLGYLPIKQEERVRALKKLESRIYNESQTQIFIETPYRNGKLVDDLIKNCQPTTRLCVAADITLDTEFIQTRMLREWKGNVPELDKRPCIFLLYK